MNIFGQIASKLLRGFNPLTQPAPEFASVLATSQAIEWVKPHRMDAENQSEQRAKKSSGMQMPAAKEETKQPNETGDEHKNSADEDAQLVEQAKAGSSRAFDRLVTKHRGRIYAMIYNMVKNDADAWDLSQEVFIKAWKALPKFESRARFSTWLFRISHNAVYDWLRKRRIQGDGELNDEVFDAAKIEPGAPTRPKQDQQPDQALEQSELRQSIDQALNKLSDEHREVVVLREVQGLDYKEIADIIGSSLGTVMSRLYYARQKLQQYLKFES
jgi:RNA polymerase sigma-70 factor (ECF subfamily)